MHRSCGAMCGPGSSMATAVGLPGFPARPSSALELELEKARLLNHKDEDPAPAVTRGFAGDATARIITAQRAEILANYDEIKRLRRELEDARANVGAKLIVEVASKSDQKAGDGTTTSCVLTQALVGEGLKLVASGANPIALQRGLQKAIELRPLARGGARESVPDLRSGRFA